MCFGISFVCLLNLGMFVFFGFMLFLVALLRHMLFVLSGSFRCLQLRLDVLQRAIVLDVIWCLFLKFLFTKSLAGESCRVFAPAAREGERCRVAPWLRSRLSFMFLVESREASAESIGRAAWERVLAKKVFLRNRVNLHAEDESQFAEWDHVIVAVRIIVFYCFSKSGRGLLVGA